VICVEYYVVVCELGLKQQNNFLHDI
jgi:hypothetical protein